MPWASVVTSGGGLRSAMETQDFRPPRMLPAEYADRLDRFGFPPVPSGPPLDRPQVVTSSGRKALAMILELCGLGPRDEVWIVTTFDKPNVSSCVTSTVFNYCKPSRVLSDATRAVLVIHEFGMPHPRLGDLRRLSTDRGIPLIEDCAHTVDSRLPDGSLVGSVGDYALYSLSKVFPIQAGGVLIGVDNGLPVDEDEQALAASVEAQAAGLWGLVPAFSAERRRLLLRAEDELGHDISRLVIRSDPAVTPWFLPVRVGNPPRVLRALREGGIECGLWHGSDIVVLPLHQFLTGAEVSFMVARLRETMGTQQLEAVRAC